MIVLPLARQGAAMINRLPSFHPRKARRDTAASCTERAAADLATAARSDNENIRYRLEHRTERWTARAELIQQTEATAGKREEPPATVQPERALRRATLHPSFGAAHHVRL
jgi:hypothetical protein